MPNIIIIGVIAGIDALAVVLLWGYVIPKVNYGRKVGAEVASVVFLVALTLALMIAADVVFRSNESDTVVLRELHASTQGDSWWNKWGQTYSGLSVWSGYGVIAAKDGVFGEYRVVGLYLANNNLVGKIPHSLTRLDKLESLHLAGNYLRGCIPAALVMVPDNDLALVDLPLCDAPRDGARIVSPESDACPPGEPCVALHGDRTETRVGEPVVLTFAAVNAITLPELTAQMVIRIPSGWAANSAEWTDACTALCNLTMKIPTGDNQTTRVEIYPNESGDFSMRATLRWFAGEEAEANANQRDEIINVRVAN